MSIENNFHWPVTCVPDYKVGYIAIPKVANTSLLNSMFSLYPESRRAKIIQTIKESDPPVDFDSPGIVHFRKGMMFDLVAKANREMLIDKFVFSCVRDPVKRFVSFYRDKILRWDPFIEEKLLSLGFKKGMPLDKCIDNLVSIEHSDLDTHILPMSYFLYHEKKLIPDFVFKIENFDSGWSVVEEYLGKKLPVGRDNNSDNQEVEKISLDNNQVSILRDYYQSDCKLFGY